MTAPALDDPTTAPTDRSGLVQPIVVGPGGGHLEIIDAVMRASVQALLDGHDDDIWSTWMSSAFTKTVRRVNQTAIEAMEQRGAAAATREGALAVAFEPMPGNGLPKDIARARVAGLERDRPPVPALGPGLWVWINGGLAMSTGKAAAQAAHALMVWALAQPYPVTIPAGIRVAEVEPSIFALGCRHPAVTDGVIHDAGHTEIAAGSATAVVVDVG
jgi:peptidyl-tRNA hydrolase